MGQHLEVRCSFVEGNAENLNKKKVLINAKHVRFFSHWARLRPLPSVDKPLGEVTTVTLPTTPLFGAGRSCVQDAQDLCQD